MKALRYASIFAVGCGLLTGGCAPPSIAVSHTGEIYVADRQAIRVCTEKTTPNGQELVCDRALKLPSK